MLNSKTVYSAAVALTLAAAYPAAAQTRTYDGGAANDNWSDVLNWSGSVRPDTASEDAVIDTGGAWSVDLDGVFTIGGLTVGSDDALTFLNGNDLGVSGDVNNAGLILLNGTNSTTAFRVDGSLTLSGTGELRIGANGTSSSTNVIGSSSSLGYVLTNAAGHTIRATGAGSLGRDTTDIINDGTVVADGTATGANGYFQINIKDTFTNNGTIRSVNDGVVYLSSGAYTNNGTIEALADAFVGTTSASTITNFNTTDSSLNGGTYRAINGRLAIEPYGSGFDLAINNATIELSGAAYSTNLFAGEFSGRSTSTQFVTNNGTLILSDGAELATSQLVFTNNGTLRVGEGSSFDMTDDMVTNFINNGSSSILAGEGTISADLSNYSGATISPGDADDEAGLLTITGYADLAGGTTLLIDIVDSNLNDVLGVGGNLGLGSGIWGTDVTVSLINGFLPVVGEQFLVATAGGDLTGDFSTITDNSALVDFVSVIDVPNGQVFLQTVAVPEPTTLALLGLGGVVMLSRKRRG